MKCLFRFWRDEQAIGTLEIILLIAVILIIAIAFRKWIIEWVQHILDFSNEEIQKSDQDIIHVPSP